MKHNGTKYKKSYKQPEIQHWILRERKLTPESSKSEIQEAKQAPKETSKPKVVINLSQYQLTPPEISLLSKGLNFIPTPGRDHPAIIIQDYLLFERKLRLKYHFD